MKHSHEDKVLLAEIKHALEKEVTTLEFPVRSRLTQARFHAIDKGLLSSRNMDKRRIGQRGIAAACLLILSVGLGYFNAPFVVDKDYYMTGDKKVLPAAMEHGDTAVESSENGDSPEEIEIYNWLYEHYG